MAALADPASNQRNGVPKTPAGTAGGATNGTVSDVENVGETAGVSEPTASSATPPTTAVPNTTAPKKAVATATNGKAAKKNLDPSEVRV
jgi:hypothetical protein